MSGIIQPFKCNTNYLISCDKQKEAWDSLVKLNTEGKLLAPNSVPVGSGLGETSINEAINYKEKQKEVAENLQKEAQQESVENITNLKIENTKRDYLIYGISLLLVLGVVVFELSSENK